MPKPKTQAQTDRATDARLLKKYGVGLDWYNAQLEKQGGGCAICKHPPGTRRLYVDHDHSWAKVKIDAMGGKTVGWWPIATYLGKEFTACDDLKNKAVRAVKVQLKRASVRGLLCYSCNAGLQKYRDRPELFRAAAKYLEDHQGVK